MNKKVMFSLSFLVLIIGCSKKEYTISEVCTTTVKNFEKHNSISYDVLYYVKYLSDDDTLSENAHCELIRDNADSLFYGTMWLKTSDSIEKYYDQKSIFSINLKNNIITEYKDPLNQKWAIKGKIVSDIYNVYFLQPEKLIEIIEDSTNVVKISDTVVDNKGLWKVTVRYPDEGPFSDSKKCIWIEKKEFSISKITFQIKFQNNYQYNEWSLSNIKFDEIKKSELSARLDDLMKSFSFEEYSEEKKNSLELLQKGDEAPEFQGKIYPENDNISLSEYRGKVVLLDFWHMACYPCIKSIPHINELHSKYSSQGLIILSLNWVDNSEKGMKRLPDFIQTNGMNYPIVLTEKNVSQSYHVSGSPTFYIINKEGEIIFSQAGFSENMNDSISNILDGLLY